MSKLVTFFAGRLRLSRACGNTQTANDFQRAADALEAAQKRIAELEGKIDAMTEMRIQDERHDAARAARGE